MNNKANIDVIGRLVSLNINVIILFLKCSHCVFHMACLRQKKRANELKTREKYSWQRYLLDALPERRTMTMHHEISARRSLMPAGDGSKSLSDTLSPTRQWGREKSGPRPYETDPFRRHLSSTLLDFKLRFSHLFISQCSHRVFHVVHSEVPHAKRLLLRWIVEIFKEIPRYTMVKNYSYVYPAATNSL